MERSIVPQRELPSVVDQWSYSDVEYWATNIVEIDLEDAKKLVTNKIKGKTLLHIDSINHFLACGIPVGPSTELLAATKLMQNWTKEPPQIMGQDFPKSDYLAEKETSFDMLRQIFPEKNIRQMEEAIRKTKNTEQAVDWMFLDEQGEVRPINSNKQVYFLFDRSYSILMNSTPLTVLSTIAKLVHTLIVNNFQKGNNNLEVMYKSFSNRPQLERHETLDSLLSKSNDVERGSSIQPAIKNLLRYIEILRRSQLSRSVTVFIFTDVDDSNSSVPLEESYAKKFNDDKGFLCFLFEYKKDSRNCRRVASNLDHLGLLRAQFSSDNSKDIEKYLNDIQPLLVSHICSYK